MATITNTIRWADNTAELKKNLLEGIGTIDAMKTSVDRMVQSLSGGGLFQAANRATAAILEMGDVTKLTAAEQERYSELLDKAIEKYKVMGMTAPPELVKVADSIRKTSSAWGEFVEGFSVEKAISDPIGTAKNALSALASTMGTTATMALTVGTAIVAVGAALFKMTADAAAAGAELDDMADKTGMSVPELSKLSLASQVVGVSLAQLTDVVFKLERGLAEGGKAFEDGLGKMSLSTQELKAAGPDHYLELVTLGLQSIADPAERAAAGTAVLGKGYRDVAASLNDLGRAMELTADIDVWTAQDAAAAEEFDFQMKSLMVHVQQLAITVGRELIPALTTLVSWIPQLGSAIKYVVVDMSGLGAMFENLRSIIGWTGAAWDVLRGKIEAPINLNAAEDAKRKLQELKDKALDAANAPDVLVKKWKDAAANMGLSVAKGADAFNVAALAEKELTDAANESIAAHKKQSEAAQKLHDDLEKNTDAAHHVEAGFFGLTQQIGKTDDSVIKFSASITASKTKIDEIERSAYIANFGFKGMADGLENVGTKVRDLGPDIEHQFVGPIQEATVSSERLSRTLKEDLTASLKAIPNMVTSALTGGGGLLGAVQGIGSMLGSKFGDSIGKSISSAASGLGALAGPIGAAIGSLAGPLIGMIGKLFGGPSQAELQGRATVQEFEAKLRSMMTMQQQAEAQGRSWAATTITVRDAFLATGRTAEEAEQVVLRLWDTKNPQAYKGAIDEINAVLNEQNADQQRAKELIDEYGISIEQLGPKWKAQQLGDQAKSLMNDYRLMIDVLGVEAPQAMSLMAGKMSEFVQQAVQGSVEIPANMQPMLEKMADMGLLTDENGNKITDLKDYGVTFAETFGQGVDRIVAKFDELIARLTESADGINAIPDSKNIDVNYNVHWNVPPMPDRNESISYGSRGGVVTSHGVQYLGGGGNVLPFAPRGGDTVPAMLTPGEGVLSNSDMMALGGPGGFRAFRRMLHMGGGSSGDAAVLGSILAAQQLQTRYLQVDFKNDIARAIRDEVQKARAS